MKVIWLQPYTGENVSVRRERISEHLENLDVEVTLVNVSGLNVVSAAFETITGDYDVIVGNVRMGLYVGYLLSTILRKPFVGDVTDPISQIQDLPRRVFKLLEHFEWFVLDRADKSVFVYQSSYEEAIERGITDPVRLPNAVDYERFADPNDTTVERAHNILTANEIDPGSPIAIYTGSMVERYHLREIGEAAEQLPEWQFVFIGKERGADVDKIVSGRSNAHFLGSFDYELIPGFLSHANLGLCLINAEQPLKLKEFTAAGLPTLVIPPMAQWHSYDNLIYTEPVPDKIASAINEIDVDPNSSRKASGEDDLESWKGISYKYYKIFRELCQTN